VSVPVSVSVPVPAYSLVLPYYVWGGFVYQGTMGKQARC